MAYENPDDGTWQSIDGNTYPDQASAENADTIYTAYNDPSRSNDTVTGGSSSDWNTVNGVTTRTIQDPDTGETITQYQGSDGKAYASLGDAQALTNTQQFNITTPGSLGWFDNRYMKSGSFNTAQAIKDFGSVAAALYAYDQAKNPPKTGYQGGIPKFTAQRETVPTAPTSRPGAGGQRFLTDTQFAPGAQANVAAGLPAAQTAVAAQKAALTAQNQANVTVNPVTDPAVIAAAQQAARDQFYGRVAPTSPVSETPPVFAMPGNPPSPQQPPNATMPWIPYIQQPGDAAPWMPTMIGPNAKQPTPEEKAQQQNELAAKTALNSGVQVGAPTADNKRDAFGNPIATSNVPEMPVMINPDYVAETPEQIAARNAELAVKTAANPTQNQNTGLAEQQASQQERQFSTTGGTMAGAQSYGLGQLQSILKDQAAQGFTPQVGAPVQQTVVDPQQQAAMLAMQQRLSLPVNTGVPFREVGSTDSTAFAQGGLMGLAKGGTPNAPRYLQGKTDGMADKIPAQIDGQQPAALAHGEFVVPADVVSHLGNGNSDAGADVLYKMMDKIRMARTGRKSQGKQINPNKFTPGGLAYAAGGTVKHFAAGDAVAPAGTTGTESNLSNWVGPYVTDMLGKGQALSEMPYQAYQGPLSAGDSALQTQAYGLAGGLQTPTSIGQAANTAGNVAGAAGNLSYSPKQATNQFTAPTTYAPTTSAFTDPGVAASYMNPYLKQSLDPQLAEARRQSQISQQTNNAQATTAGAFGGARQGIMAAEGQRNLGANLANITGQGYNTAYNNAQQQFNADQARKMQEAQFGAQQGMTGAQQTAQYGQASQAQNAQEAQFGANYGLQGLQTQLSAANAQGNLGNIQNQAGLANLNAMAGLGATQQATAQAGIAADQAAFNQERDNPYKMVQYQQSLLQGLPLAAQQYNIQTNPWNAAAGAAGAVLTSPAG